MPSKKDEKTILNKIRKLSEKNYGKKKYLYQPLEHPYFKGFHVKNFDMPKKAKTIGKHLNGNLVIDLGCNAGYLGRYLTKRKFYVIGVDHAFRPKGIHDNMVLLGNPDFDYRLQPFDKFMRKNPTAYRTCSVTGLAVFHWFLKTKDTYTELVNVIAPWIKNNARQFFFEYCPLFGKQKYKDFSKQDWITFWMKHGGFTKYREVYISPRMKRTIILFEKEFTDIDYKDDIIYIDPKSIKYLVTGYDDIKLWYMDAGYRGIKKVMAKGDWDKLKKYPIQEQPVHKQMVKRFVENRPWSEIKLGQNKRQERESEALYKSMKQKGYKSKNTWDEVCIAIGRDGTRFLMNGRHRTAMAQIQNVKRMPVRVLLVHKDYKADWIKGRTFLKAY